MKIVQKTKGNLKKCLCMKCPSYVFACKVKSMAGNVILRVGDMENKIHAEALFCAYEPSNCIDELRGCLCEDCEVLLDNDLENGFYCKVDGGK